MNQTPCEFAWDAGGDSPETESAVFSPDPQFEAAKNRSVRCQRGSRKPTLTRTVADAHPANWPSTPSISTAFYWNVRKSDGHGFLAPGDTLLLDGMPIYHRPARRRGLPKVVS